MRGRTRFPIVALLGALCASSIAPARSQTPVRAALADDKGKFEVSVDGKVVATEEFSVAHEGGGWVARGSTEFHTASNGTGHITGELHLNAAGAPVRYQWVLAAEKTITSTTTFDGNHAKMSTDVGQTTPLDQDFLFTSQVVILDNNLYDQYGILARLYNWSARGPQTFAVLIPQEHQPGSITVEATGNQQLRVHTSDIDVFVNVDSSHRVMRISVPASKAEIVRK